MDAFQKFAELAALIFCLFLTGLTSATSPEEIWLNRSAISRRASDSPEYFIYLKYDDWRCITCDCADGKIKENSKTTIDYCYPTGNQLFYIQTPSGENPTSFRPSGADLFPSGEFIIKASRNGACLDISGTPSPTGTSAPSIVQRTCGNPPTATQRWRSRGQSGTTYVLLESIAYCGFCIMPNGKLDIGSPVVLFNCDVPSPQKRWEFKVESRRRALLSNDKSGHSLESPPQLPVPRPFGNGDVNEDDEGFLTRTVRADKTKFYLYLYNGAWRCITCNCADGPTTNQINALAYCYPTNNQLFYFEKPDGSHEELANPSGATDGTGAPSEAYWIVNARNSQCLDLYLESGVYWIVSATCDTNLASQRWRSRASGLTDYGYWLIENQAHCAWCITPQSYSIEEHAKLHLWPCDNRHNHQMIAWKQGSA